LRCQSGENCTLCTKKLVRIAKKDVHVALFGKENFDRPKQRHQVVIFIGRTKKYFQQKVSPLKTTQCLKFSDLYDLFIG
jgi:hypothetical protein